MGIIWIILNLSKTKKFYFFFELILICLLCFAVTEFIESQEHKVGDMKPKEWLKGVGKLIQDGCYDIFMNVG